MKTKFFIPILIIFGLLLPLVLLMASNIVDDVPPAYNKWSWGENIGWMNWKPSFGGTDYGVTVYDDRLEGYIWAENVGWINLSPVTYGGVTNDGLGNLSGYAWGENVGWISFSSDYHQVVINGEGEFTGYAWGENIGWINMNCANSEPSYCGTVDFKVKTSWTANQAPTVDSVSLNGGNNITLTPNATTSVSATGTVSDADGYGDISQVMGRIYRSGVSGAENCTLDNNNCYEDTSCATSSCAGNTCNYSCDFNVQFHADPTDNGTYATAQDWNTQKWVAWVKVIDSQSASSTATNSAETVDVNTLTAVSVTPSITYDALDPDTNMANLTKTTNATNTGNVPIDVQLKGDDMTYSGNTIAVGNQRYATSSVAWASGIALTGSYVTLEIDLPKPTTSPSNSTSTIYWAWAVPTGKPAGTYTGINYFNAIED